VGISSLGVRGTAVALVVLALGGLSFSKLGASAPPRAKKAGQQTRYISNPYDKLPLRFERNDGQTDARVKFISRGEGYTLFLTPSEAVLSSVRGKKKDVLRVKMVGANPQARIEGIDQLAGRSNYFIGGDPKKWRTNIPSYSKVRYRDVYPGIDLVYYGNPPVVSAAGRESSQTAQRQLEYDFILAPGANPEAIELRFQGSKELALN